MIIKSIITRRHNMVKLRIHIQYKITDSTDMTLHEQEKETKSKEQNL